MHRCICRWELVAVRMQSVGPVDVALDKMTAGPSSPILYGLIRNEDQNLASLSFGFLVPIVKCIVENIAVDISFNQLGGLCALCFHEEDNFYVSIWGPVPISSIPDMAAVDPPRRYGGELLLSESVYAYIAAYTVLPLGQRNPNFKLKCFNIIDPLLWNNNLGISVSEDNSSRILGAFSDGARQLAKLLDCPEENPIAEVDRFFRNTWDRYGKGSRLGAPSPEIDGSYSFRNNVSNTSFEVKENSTGSDPNAVVKCASHAPHGVPSQHDKQSLTQISRTGNVSPVSRTESQEVFANTTSSMSSDQNNGLQNISSYENSQTDIGRSSRSNSLRNEEHDRNLYGRLHSNSELMDVSAEVPSRQRSNNIIRVNLGRNVQRNLVTPYQHYPNPVYGYAADPNLVYGYPAEHFSGVDEASHVDEGPSSVHDSEFPSPD
ncbi:hypothetical protein Q3G72_009811 [Acer saccharum]|nr:hypothetical protein Q3G72_009811 [Acer saccharum]